MRIAWFTPFRKASAIGRFSQLVTERLAQDAVVDLWLAEAETEETHSTQLRIIRYPELALAEHFLSEYDAIAYNLGDHVTNHGPIFEMSRRVPGIVILHDYVLHHFFVSYYDQRKELAVYVEMMKRWYGADLRKTSTGWTGDAWRAWERDQVTIRYPLFEEAIVGCVGVITHADFAQEAVSRVAGAPVTKIPLAYAADTAGPVLSRDELRVPEDRILVVTVGRVNENKRIHVMMQVLAANRDLARSLAYVVVGGCDGPFAQGLQALREELDLEDAVRFTGHAPDLLLRSFVVHAAFCVNLRWPAMEAGSASCAEEMLYGKALIVTDTGVYRELPDTCVRKVRPEHEVEDLTRHLRDLAGNGDLRNSMGEQARAYAEANFNPSVYARRFIDFCAEMPFYQPAIHLMDTAGRELRQLGVTPGMAIVDTVVRESALLMDGDYDPPILRKK